MSVKRVFSLLLVIVLTVSLIPAGSAASSLPSNVSVATGKFHSVLATEDGRLFVWGDNSKGQLGTGTTVQQNTPVQIMDGVYQVAAGDYTSYALTYSGDLYAWGNNENNECGKKGTANIFHPELIMHNIVSIAATETHAYAVTSSGDLYFWGRSAHVGFWPYYVDVVFTYIQPGGLSESKTPQKIMDDVKEVYCHEAGTTVIKTDGSLWNWSRYSDVSAVMTDEHYDADGILNRTWTMTPVKMADAVLNVSNFGGAYLDKDGAVHYWYGTMQDLPEELEGKVSSLYTTDIMEAYITNNGDLYVDCIGPDILSGTGATESSLDSVKLIARDVKTLCIGENHAVMVKRNGEVWTWGTNEYGQLGNGTGVNYNVPYRILMGNGTQNTGGLNNLTSVIFDGKKMQFDVEPVVRNGRTLVPFRAIFEALGATVLWNGNTSSAIAEKDGTTVKITVGSNTAYVNGEPYTLDAAPEMVSDRNMVPLRFISEAMNCKVDFMASDNIVDIRSPSAFNLLNDEVKKKLINCNVYIECGNYGSEYYYTASGVLIDSSGIILTSQHVINGVDWIESTINGVTYKDYEVIYEDEELNFAIYRLIGVKQKFASPTLGDSGKLKKDDELFCCANPSGIKDQCCRGTVCTVWEDGIDSYLFAKPGSSGGGIYNQSLDLVGLLYAADNWGTTLVIPMALMREKIDDSIAQYGIALPQGAA